MPGHRGDASQEGDAGGIALGFFDGDSTLNHAHVVEEDGVDEQPAGLIPQRLFVFGAIAQPAGVDMRERFLEMVVLLAAIERSLHIAPQLGRIDVAEEVLAAVNGIVLPQRLEHLAAPLGGAELAHQDAVRGGLASQ